MILHGFKLLTLQNYNIFFNLQNFHRFLSYKNIQKNKELFITVYDLLAGIIKNGYICNLKEAI